MRLPRLLLSVLLPCSLALQTGCITATNSVDYWSQIITPCEYLVAGTGPKLREEEKLQTTLTPACREALDDILPFEPSFDAAPRGMKDHLLEAFQILAAYPLELPPENRFFGVAPGSIPALHLCLMGAPDCPAVARPQPGVWQAGNYRKNIFNAVVNAFDSIGYNPDPEIEAVAQNGPDLAAGINGRRLLLTRYFWNGSQAEDIIAGKFGRAGTLVHEAGHSAGYFHQICSDTGKPSCDADLKGPYGLGATYLELVMHGSGEAVLASGEPLLSDYDLISLGTQICLSLKYRVVNVPAALRRLLEKTSCPNIGSDWVIEKEDFDREFPPQS